MTNLNFQIGQTVTFKNRTYIIKHIDVTAEKFPSIKRHHPNIELHIIVKGVRGALKDGIITTNGNMVLF